MKTRPSARPAPSPRALAGPAEPAGWLAGLVIGVAAWLAYHNSFAVPFVFDDELAIVGNSSLRNLGTAWWPPAELSGLPMSGRPVVNFSFGLSYAISGREVWSYHVLNLLIHIAAGTVLFGVVRRTLHQVRLAPRFGAHAFGLALVTALLWTLHPLQTESVTFISQRAEAMVGLFYLLTLWLFMRAIEPGAAPRWARWAVVTCALGMITKEVMVSAPIFAALYDRAFVTGSWREVWQRHGRILLALAGTWVVLALVVLHEGGARGASAGFGLGVSPWTYLLTQCEAIVIYLKLSFWPHPLVLDYGTWLAGSAAEVWWQGLLVLGLFVATLWALVRRPMLACFGAWFFLILAPSSSIVPLVGQTIAEHRMYLPLAAVVALVAAGSYRLVGRPALFGLAAAAVALGVTTEFRNRDYATTISICEDTVAKRPENARARALLADYYRRAGRLDDARAQLERSLQIEPGVVAVLNNLGTVYQELGQPAKAEGFFREALRHRPTDVGTMNNLGNALVLMGRTAEGVAELQAALAVRPTAWETRYNLASALAQSGRMDEAAVQFEALARTRPQDAEIHNSYSDVLTALGRKPEALLELAAAVKAAPGNADLHNRLGTALGRSGRVREALDEFEAALQLNPDHASARQNAERARQMLGLR